jgi:hypothetical protein
MAERNYKNNKFTNELGFLFSLLDHLLAFMRISENEARNGKNIFIANTIK